MGGRLIEACKYCGCKVLNVFFLSCCLQAGQYPRLSDPNYLLLLGKL